MATTSNLKDFLTSLGFSESSTYDVPKDPADASLASVNAFIRENSDNDETASCGVIHIAGPSIVGNSAPVKAVGGLLTSVQGAVDAIGASIAGVRSTHGAIPSSISGRTQMSLVASPMPGSVVIQVAPTLDRMTDLYPHGEALFDIEEESGTKPLADLAFNEFSTLVRDLEQSTPDDSLFIDRLADLGPRVASAMKEFCESVNKGVLDVDFEWREPGKNAESSFITHSQAKRAVKVIEDANIENEDISIEGVLLTVTTSDKDKLRVLEDTGKEVIVTIGDISPTSLFALRTGERVIVHAERRVSNRPGGRQVVKIMGLSVETIPTLNS